MERPRVFERLAPISVEPTDPLPLVPICYRRPRWISTFWRAYQGVLELLGLR